MKEFEGKVSFAQHLSPGSFDLPKVLRLGKELFLGVKLALLEIIRGSI